VYDVTPPLSERWRPFTPLTTAAAYGADVELFGGGLANGDGPRLTEVTRETGEGLAIVGPTMASESGLPPASSTLPECRDLGATATLSWVKPPISSMLHGEEPVSSKSIENEEVDVRRNHDSGLRRRDQVENDGLLKALGRRGKFEGPLGVLRTRMLY
jgi:hypothetical protein